MTRPTVQAGRQILDIITSGMYNQPLMVYREYVQNAADSIDAAVAAGHLGSGEGRIDITLDGKNRCVTVVDNGMGMPRRDALRQLCSIGISSKEQGQQRGFRGIGRLGALAYCRTLRFETKSAADKQVAVVEWDATKLRSALQSEDVIDEVTAAIHECASVKFRSASGEPERFFRVTMQGVNRFYSDELMTVDSVTSYLSQVAPVPFDDERFTHAESIRAYLSDISGFRTYSVTVNGTPVLRPHQDAIDVSAKQQDNIHSVKLFPIRGTDGQEIGRGWYAETQYLGSIPPRVAMRGVRVLQGNIQVGDNRFLVDAFTEPRFASWHIGEIHLSYAVRANARRDDFEQTKDWETFLEQASRLGMHLSSLCRQSSKHRSQRFRAIAAAEKLKALKQVSFAVDENHRQEVQALMDSLGEAALGGSNGTSNGNGRLPVLRDVLDGRKLCKQDSKDIVEAVAKRIVTHWGSTPEVMAGLQVILSPYMKSR